MHTFVDHAFFAAHAAEHGIPAADLPIVVREAYQAAGLPIPSTRAPLMGVVTPPGEGFCCHCGTPVPTGQHARAHAVAGFEHLTHPDGGAARMRVNHCDACAGGDGCDRATPGFCEEVQA